ncbi:CapA family protein [Marinactinospora thermotolerans]|uniref:CapA family protein n=1 Tax=Marinactinospora thermotolerans TaxID=531310 RepID=UPI003D90FDA4
MPPIPLGTSHRLRAALALLILTTTSCGADGTALGSGAEAVAGASCPSGGRKGRLPVPFTIAFGGDVHFEGVLRSRLDASPAEALGDVGSTLSAADIAMVDPETAVTDAGTPAPGKRFLFRAPATAFTALREAGVDVATLANNHGMDYGPDGLADTLASAGEAGFPLVGAGPDADAAYAPHVLDVSGNRVALFGATDVLDDHLVAEWTAGAKTPGLASTKGEDLQRLVTAVRAAEAEADTVVVFLHWGREGDHCPLPHAPDLARRLVEAGADAVVGGHSHVLGPGGHLDGAYVHYGLGNLAFHTSHRRDRRTAADHAGR